MESCGESLHGDDADEILSSVTLLDRLARRGMSHVTLAMLDNDVHDGFLPHRPWAAFVLPRATRLYRLKKRGLVGERLRLILYLADGWGWSQIKSTAVAGLQKSIRSSQIGLRKTFHKSPSPADLDFALEEIAGAQNQSIAQRLTAEQSVGLRPTSATTLRFVLGVGLHGDALDGGTLERLTPFAAQLNRDSMDVTHMMRALTEFTIRAEKLTWDKQLAILQSVDDEVAMKALPGMRRFILDLRRLVHRADDKPKKSSSNPLTLFGNYKRSIRDGFWKNSPDRITPAQMLGAWIGTMIIARVIFDRSEVAKVLDVLEAASASETNITETDGGAPDPR